MSDSVRSNYSNFSTCSRRTSMTEVSEADLRRLEELREIGKKAKNKDSDIHSESALSTLSKCKLSFKGVLVAGIEFSR